MPVFREKLKCARLAFVLVVGLVMCGQMKGLAQEKRFDFTMNPNRSLENMYFRGYAYNFLICNIL